MSRTIKVGTNLYQYELDLQPDVRDCERLTRAAKRSVSLERDALRRERSLARREARFF